MGGGMELLELQQEATLNKYSPSAYKPVHPSFPLTIASSFELSKPQITYATVAPHSLVKISRLVQSPPLCCGGGCCLAVRWSGMRIETNESVAKGPSFKNPK